jgi:hypothetical protein
MNSTNASTLFLGAVYIAALVVLVLDVFYWRP